MGHLLIIIVIGLSMGAVLWHIARAECRILAALKHTPDTGQARIDAATQRLRDDNAAQQQAVSDNTPKES